MKTPSGITRISTAALLWALLAAAPAAAADNGVMFEEFLFWDNGEFMKRIGLGK